MRRYAICGFVMLAASFVNAQWVPVVSKIREATVVTDTDGKVIEQTSKDGNFFRNSEGSTLTQWVASSAPERTPSSGELMDNKNLALYQLQYQTKLALLKRKLNRPRSKSDESKLLPANNLGKSAVEGVPCTLVPAWSSNSRIGQGCYSYPYDLSLWEEVTITTRGGQTSHIRREMYGLKLNVEPDRRLFDVSQFTVAGSIDRRSAGR